MFQIKYAFVLLVSFDIILDDLEKYVLNNLPSYKSNKCMFPGIKGTDDIKHKINDLYRSYGEESMKSTILFKGNTAKTNVTQQIFLQSGNLYLHVDSVMKEKTSKAKTKKILLGTSHTNLFEYASSKKWL